MLVEKKLSGKERRRLRSKFYDINVSFWIGKRGLNENLVKNIELHLRKNKVVKLKFQRSIIKDSRKKVIQSIIKDLIESMRINVEVLDIRGRCVILYKL